MSFMEDSLQAARCSLLYCPHGHALETATDPSLKKAGLDCDHHLTKQNNKTFRHSIGIEGTEEFRIRLKEASMRGYQKGPRWQQI